MASSAARRITKCLKKLKTFSSVSHHLLRLCWTHRGTFLPVPLLVFRLIIGKHSEVSMLAYSEHGTATLRVWNSDLLNPSLRHVTMATPANPQTEQRVLPSRPTGKYNQQGVRVATGGTAAKLQQELHDGYLLSVTAQLTVLWSWLGVFPVCFQTIKIKYIDVYFWKWNTFRGYMLMYLITPCFCARSNYNLAALQHTSHVTPTVKFILELGLLRGCGSSCHPIPFVNIYTES